MKTKIVFDTELKRPGCVLLQAALGGSTEAAHRFPAETWLTHPTDNMRLFEATEDQLNKLVSMAQQACQGDPG